MTLRPRFFDRLCVVLLVWIGLQMLVMAGLFARGIPPSTVHCDRAEQRCTTYFASIFGGDHHTSDLADWHTSDVVANADGTSSWKVQRGKDTLWLGLATKDRAEVARYRQLAAELERFLDDPHSTTFDARFQTVRTAPWPMFVVVGLILSFFGFRWWRGWYAEIELDAATREITIHQRPMFFTGPRTVTYTASDLRLGEGVENHYIGSGQRAKFARFVLRDSAGKRVFSYLTLYDQKSRAALDGYMQLLAGFLSTR